MWIELNQIILFIRKAKVMLIFIQNVPVSFNHKNFFQLIYYNFNLIIKLQLYITKYISF